mmetsp:Transcript_3636/g.13298  ORF Transcript_3636/g.13298 Transcript_3636/m.13298 type:complete len:361 (+) Transcript_3636:130-1212(+)
MLAAAPVFVPFARLPLLRGMLVARHDRFTAWIQLEGSDEVVEAHCVNPGRMEGCVAAGAAVWVEAAAPGARRRTKFTWELVERGGVLCATNAVRPNLLVGEALRRRCLAGLDGYVALAAEKTLSPPHGRSRCDFHLLDADGTEHWIEVKHCHAHYAGEPLLQGWGYFPDSVSARAAKHCRALADLAQRPKTKAWVIIVVQRCMSRGVHQDQGVSRGVRPSPYHDPTFAATARAAAASGVDFRAVLAECGIDGTTLFAEAPFDGTEPTRAALEAMHRAVGGLRPGTGWTRTFGAGGPKRVAHGPFAHNRHASYQPPPSALTPSAAEATKRRRAADDEPAIVTPTKNPRPTASPHFPGRPAA